MEIIGCCQADITGGHAMMTGKNNGHGRGTGNPKITKKR